MLEGLRLFLIEVQVILTEPHAYIMPGTYLAWAQTHVDHAGPGGGTLCTEQHYRRDITFAQGSATGGARTWHMGLGTCTTRAR